MPDFSGYDILESLKSESIHPSIHPTFVNCNYRYDR